MRQWPASEPRRLPRPRELPEKSEPPVWPAFAADRRLREVAPVNPAVSASPHGDSLSDAGFHAPRDGGRVVP